jgi:hypothetical protein
MRRIMRKSGYYPRGSRSEAGVGYPGSSSSYERVRAPSVPGGSASAAVVAIIRSVLTVGPSTIRLRVKDVEVLVEVDVYLGAVGLGDLDLVVALLILELGGGHAALYLLERDALGLVHSGSRGLPG